MEVDEMTVHLALRGNVDPQQAAAKVRDLFHTRLELTPNHVEFLGLEPMLRKIGMETEMKERRFVDARPRP
jgi:hypothetical protein